MKSQRASVGDDELAVAVQAGNPTVLFFHGLAGHCGNWSRDIDHLGPEIGIINPDQRVHASSWVLRDLKRNCAVVV